MRRRQTPDFAWWKDLSITDRLREQIRARFTLVPDGYVIWYKGHRRAVCGKRTPPEEVEARWEAKRAAIDAAGAAVPLPILGRRVRTYREVMGGFLDVKASQVGAKRNSIEERTLHNYSVELNAFGSFIHEGAKIADMDIRDIGPEQLSAYARTFAGWKSSGFDSVVSRVGALFRWAIEMEYIDRYRPGPEFRRPDKKEIRSERIELEKSFTPAEAATLYLAGNHTMKCWVALGVCAAFNNADVANLPRSLIDLDTGVIDYRRRKSGKIRRVIPLPADVLALLKQYIRPDPAAKADADLFFITAYGNAYARAKGRDGELRPSNTISRLFAKLLDETELSRRGRNFSGLRTTHYNLAPRDVFTTERKIVVGRALGTVDLDHYLEEVGMERLKEYVGHIWAKVTVEIEKQRKTHQILPG